VLALTRDSAIEFLREVTVAPITSTIRDIPTEVMLDESNGMARPCALNLDHVQTVPKERLGGTLTTLDRATMRDVARALAFALDLSG
jgi:mRNA interferase MazF